MANAENPGYGPTMAPTTQEWLELVADYQDSPGRPLRAFAKEHGVDHKAFREWVKRVRLEGAGSADAPATAPAASDATRLDNVLIEAARVHGGLSITQVANAAGVSRSVARKWLNWLVEEGRLQKTGRSASQRFIIP